MKVRMEADAPGTGPAARSAAMQSAERQIIFQVLQVALATDNLNLLTTLSENPSRYIRSTQLIQYETKDDATHVEIESYVKRDDLLRDAAATLLPQLPVPPTAIVLMAERLTADSPWDATRPGLTEKALVEALRKAKFGIVDSQIARACYAKDDLAARLQTDSAADVARQAFAEVTVAGSAETASTSRGNIFTTKAKVSIRIFRSMDGKLIEALEHEAVVHGADPDEANAAAIQDACDKLAKDMVLYATLAAVGPVPENEVVVTVENPGDRGHFDPILAVARKAASGSEATEPSSPSSTRGPKELFYSNSLARFRLRYDGPMSALIDALTSGPYAGFSVEVHKAVQKNVTLRILSAAPSKQEK